MKEYVKKIADKAADTKAWLVQHNVAQYLKILVFAYLVFVWVLVMTGSLGVALIYLASSVCVLLLKHFLLSKDDGKDKQRPKIKKILYLIFFVFTAVAAFCLSLSISDALNTLTSLLTWIFIYVSFQKSTSIKEWVLGALIPFGIMLFAEFMQDNVRIAWRYMFGKVESIRFGYPLSMIVVISVCYCLIHLLNSKRLGYYVAGGIFGFLSIVNFFVCAYTEQPFTFSDIKLARTAAGVLKAQALEPTDWLRFGIGLILLAVYFVVITLIYQHKPVHKKISRRIISSGIACLLAVGLFFTSNSLGSAVLLYQGHIKYSYIGNLFITMNSRIDMPKDAKDYVVEDKNDAGDYNPNVIIIMNEAFSDFEATFGVSLNEDPLPYFHSLQESYPHGVTYSSVKGNNTCSSEWELLSGSPTALTAKGAMVYKDNDKPMRSIVSLFNSRGYTTVGFHPYYAFGYNRNSIYKNLGFDQIVFLEDLEKDMDTYRGFVTDEADYKKVIQMYEENEQAGDAPFFCFNITMQNHGAYKIEQSDDIHLMGEQTYSDVNTYLSGLPYSDEALKMLISYFENVEEDTIIMMFGDHQPLIDNVFYEDVYGKAYNELTLDELKEVYAAPYLIWANYELNEEEAPEETSNCYLTNILFNVGNLPKSTWLHMVDEYQKEYPIVSAIFTKDAKGEIYETRTLVNSKEQDTTDLLTLYRKYSYGILYGLE